MTHARVCLGTLSTIFRRLRRLLALAFSSPASLLPAGCPPLLALAITPLGLSQRPRPRRLATAFAAIATARTSWHERSTAALEKTLASTRPASGGLYIRPNRDML